MRRFAWLVAIGTLCLVATACAPQGATTPAPTATGAPTATPQPQPTPATATAAPTSAPQQITREMVFQIQPGEWARGPQEAAVTIIEWGDFQ